MLTYSEQMRDADDLTRDEVLRVIDQHGLFADYDETGEIFDPVDGETIAWADSRGLYDGNTIANWLGY